MEELTTLFDAFYSRFVLRDLLAKITPGAIVLFTIYIILPPEIVSDILRLFRWTDFWTWIFVATFSWIIGFAIQGLGDFLQIIQYHPKLIDRKNWYNMYVDLFSNKVPKFHQHQVERFTVIKEACGNGCIALSISLILLYRNLIKVPCGVPCGLVITLLLILSLWYMHVAHVQREYSYIRVCLIRFLPEKYTESLPKIQKWDLIKEWFDPVKLILFILILFLLITFCDTAIAVNGTPTVSCFNNINIQLTF